MGFSTDLKYIESKSRVRKDGCREWMGYRDPKGYGHVSFQGRRTPVHRVVWQLVTGRKPEGHLHHLCEHKWCCEFSHLEEIEPGEHTLRHKTNGDLCVNGHPWAENTYYRKDGKGRICRACSADRMRRYYREYSPEQRAKDHRRKSESRVKGKGVKCPECGQRVAGQHGLRVHLSKGHSGLT